jgi:predicted nucleic acid-binding protein
MRNVFVDTNIILDVLLQNEGFWQDSQKIFKLAERGELRASVSASSITDIFYVTRKKLTTPVARAAIEKLLYLFEVVSIDVNDLRGALTIPIDDVEDALQAWCAQKINADALITRNVSDFKNINIAVVTPDKFA